MDRRQLIVGGAAVAVLGVAYLTDTSIERQTIKSRQEFLDDIVAQELSHFVDGVVYSHDDKFLLEDIPLQYAERTLQDPELAAMIVRDIYPEIDKAYAQGMFLGDFRAQFLEAVSGVYRDLISQDLVINKNPPAVLLQFPFDYSKGKRSTLVVRKSAFKAETVNFNGSEVTIGIEDKIRAILWNQYQHARYKYYGLRLTSELFIDGSNYRMIGPNVKFFVDGSQAFMDQVEHFAPLGTSNPSFLYSLASLRGFIEPPPTDAVISSLEPLEQMFVMHQLERYKTIQERYRNLNVGFKFGG